MKAFCSVKSLLAVAAGLSLSVCLAGSAVAADKILIGAAVPTSGDLASYGIPSANAAKLVADEVNAKGGILGGRMIEIMVEDDQCKPEVATAVATKLLSAKVPVVVGHICSGATKAALPVYKGAGMLVMSPSATNPALTLSGDYPNFYRTIGHDLKQAAVQVPFAIDTLKAQKIAVLHDKQEYGLGLANEVKKLVDAKGGAKVVLFEGITAGQVDYSAVIQKVRQSGADVVVYGGYHPEASKLVAQMKQKGMKAPFIGPDGVKDDTFIKVAGKDAEGVYATGPADVSSNPMTKKYAEAHKAKFGTEPGAFFANGVSATLAYVNAMVKANSTEPAAIAKALKSEKVETPVGNISFDEKGDAIGVGFSVYQVKDGKFVEVK